MATVLHVSEAMFTSFASDFGAFRQKSAKPMSYDAILELTGAGDKYIGFS